MARRDVGDAGQGVRVHAGGAVIEGEVALLQAQAVVEVALEPRRQDLDVSLVSLALMGCVDCV